MRKVIVGILLALVFSPAVLADVSGAGGLGVFGSWWDSKDYDALYGGGVGYYLKDAEYDDEAGTWDTSEEVSGTFALAGLNLYLGAVSLFAEAKYNFVETDDDLRWRGDGVEAKNSLDGFSYSVGLKLGF